MVYRQRQKINMTTVCMKLDREVPDDITECTGYNNPHEMQLDHMTEIATIIDVREGINPQSFL